VVVEPRLLPTFLAILTKVPKMLAELLARSELVSSK
jgi:hypothetical protein